MLLNRRPDLRVLGAIAIVLQCWAAQGHAQTDPVLGATANALSAPPPLHAAAGRGAAAAGPVHVARPAFPRSSSSPHFPPPQRALIPAMPDKHAPPAPMPYSAVGHFEAGGVRMAVLVRGDAILLKKQGEVVGDEFRLVAVDPPALLHLPTGAVLPVRRALEAGAPIAVSTPAALMAPDPIVVSALPAEAAGMAEATVTAEITGTADAAGAAEIEADIARALATPAPPRVAGSAFPLAR